jgi:hypothetical protein
MSNEILKEKWKTVKFNLDFTPTNNHSLQVSSLGNLRSINNLNGKVNHIKGSTVNGYNIIRLKFYKQREASGKRKLTIQLNEVIKEENILQELEATKNKNKKAYNEQAQKVATLKKTLTKAYDTDRKNRSVYWHALVHRLVAENFVKKTDRKQTVVAHIDYDKNNNAATNLVWMTKEVNIEHQKTNPNTIAAIEKRKTLNPESLGSSKLKTKHVLEIKKELAKNTKVVELAKKFKVSETQIRRIKSGENWSMITI